VKPILVVIVSAMLGVIDSRAATVQHFAHAH
jgi:hypothetical protein